MPKTFWKRDEDCDYDENDAGLRIASEYHFWIVKDYTKIDQTWLCKITIVFVLSLISVISDAMQYLLWENWCVCLYSMQPQSMLCNLPLQGTHAVQQ